MIHTDLIFTQPNREVVMASINLVIQDKKRDTLKAEAKKRGLRFYPYLEKELEKIADRLEKKK